MVRDRLSVMTRGYIPQLSSDGGVYYNNTTSLHTHHSLGKYTLLSHIHQCFKNCSPPLHIPNRQISVWHLTLCNPTLSQRKSGAESNGGGYYPILKGTTGDFSVVLVNLMIIFICFIFLWYYITFAKITNV